MICFKTWIKDFGEPSDHLVVLPKNIDIMDPTAIINDYGPTVQKALLQKEIDFNQSLA
jgi:hypothetical protein